MDSRPRSIHEIAADISQSRQWLSALPRYHPLRPICVSLLAYRLFERYDLSHQKDDLETSILYFTESLLFFPLSWLAHGPMILEVFLLLARSLLKRSVVSLESEDAIYAAKYLRYVRGPAHAPFAYQRQPTTAWLVEVLAFQMELKASDVVQTLDEMAILTNELLTSEPCGAPTARAISLFAGSLSPHASYPLPGQLLNQIIMCLRLARMHKPELRELHFLLAKCLFTRYSNNCVTDDLDDAATIVDEMIASSSPGDVFEAECQELEPLLAIIRSVAKDTPENSEDIIYRARTFLASSSVEDPLYPMWSHVLEHAEKTRFEHFGLVDGLKGSSSNLPTYLELRTGNSERRHKTTLLDELINEIRSNHVTDIDEAIELGRSILASSDPSDLGALYIFSDILFEAFKRTSKIEYLNESINTRRHILACQPPMSLLSSTTSLLIGSLLTRIQTSPSHNMQDLHEVVELYPQYVNDGSGWVSFPRRLQSACYWAYYAQATQHPSISMAYETALSLMQDAILFAPTLQLQHATLSLGEGYHEMPLDYASHQVYLSQLEQAIETLERGRALLWSEMRQLRISSDQLIKTDLDLGDKFTAVNRDLEELTKSIPPSHKVSMDDAVADDIRAGDQFGRFLLKQRGLLKERDELISKIRALPGFDRFLMSPSFDTVRSAASSGPVIIINHSKWRSDIIILLHNASPTLIPTPSDFYKRVIALKDKLLTSRDKDGLDSNQYGEILASILVELYKLVGKPVIERLRQLKVPEQSRIWWCPTSVFCSLPLHAMGPFPSDNGELRYFLDLYICSYTPSLSALIQSRSRDSSSQSLDRPPLLLVAQADPSLPTVGDEIQVVRTLDTEVTSLISELATPAAVIDGFRHHRFVHFACHGTLEAGKPFEAGFELHGRERLTLLEIVHSDLPTAEFAFLSACHTAEVTEGSIMDEGLHLAAAVQYSGFRSVVGTMWAMMDEDGPDLAENFYKALFSNSRRDEGRPYHERAAKALRYAVKKLRRKRYITLERWVNFVHYGA